MTTARAATADILVAVAHLLARLEPEARHPAIRFALPLAPEAVVETLLGDARVSEARLSTLGTLHGPGARFVLERGSDGHFTLAGRASEPGIWEPGAYVVLEGRVERFEAGVSELVLRFRLHPLTRAAYLVVALVAGLIIPLQLWTTGLLLGTAMMFPIVLAAMVIGLDSRRLRDQRVALQRLVEELLTPLALAREAAPACPFRRSAGARRCR